MSDVDLARLRSELAEPLPHPDPATLQTFGKDALDLLVRHSATLAEQPGKDGRNVAVTALRKRLGFVQGLIQQCNVQLDPPDAATLDPGSGTHPI